ncbi:MAG TPA: transposase [Bryobacteraceae bacterium]
MVVEACIYNANVLSHFTLHAFVIMPNHVHLLLTPSIPLAKLTKSLKDIPAKRANLMLGLTGISFWQEESYDHQVRHDREFEQIRRYIENNPVRAGLCGKPASIVGPAPGGNQGVARRTRSIKLVMVISLCTKNRAVSFRN